MTHFTDVETLKEFMFAGRAKFTVKSKRTNKHFTFKIRKDRDSGLWFVHCLTGENNYLYLGTIFADSGFRWTRKTFPVQRNGIFYNAFKWFYEKIDQGILPKDIEVYHSGHCGMCGRELTDPISIKEGFGPECRSKRLRHSFAVSRA